MKMRPGSLGAHFLGPTLSDLVTQLITDGELGTNHQGPAFVTHFWLNVIGLVGLVFKLVPNQKMDFWGNVGGGLAHGYSLRSWAQRAPCLPCLMV